MKKLFPAIAAAAALLLGAASSAWGACSTVIPTQPAQNSNLSSAPIRQNFASTYTDINNILGMFVSATAPAAPCTGQFWRDTSASPNRIKQWDGAAWVLWGILDTVGHTFSASLSSGTVVATPPIAASFSLGVVTLSLGMNARFAVVANQLALAPIPSGNILSNTTGGAGEPIGTSPTAWLDQWCSASNDQVPYRTGGAWSCLGLLGTAHAWTGQQNFDVATANSLGFNPSSTVFPKITMTPGALATGADGIKFLSTTGSAGHAILQALQGGTVNTGLYLGSNSFVNTSGTAVKYDSAQPAAAVSIPQGTLGTIFLNTATAGGSVTPRLVVNNSGTITLSSLASVGVVTTNISGDLATTPSPTMVAPVLGNPTASSLVFDPASGVFPKITMTPGLVSAGTDGVRFLSAAATGHGIMQPIYSGANIGFWWGSNSFVNTAGATTKYDAASVATGINLNSVTGAVTIATATAGGSPTTRLTVGNTGTITVAGLNAAGVVTTNSSGDLATNTTLPAAQEPAHTGDVTNTAGSLVLTIAANAVTYAKMQSVTASRLLGNPTGGGAVPSEISLGSTLNFSGTSLNCTTGTNAQLGCFRVDNTTITASGGVISAVGGVATSVTVGTTTVTGGTSPFILYNNAGVLGNVALAAGTGIALSGTANATIGLNVTTGSNALGADVALNNTANFFDGPSVAQGATGTWFASGTVSLLDTAAAAYACKLWDGTTEISSAAQAINVGNQTMSITLSGFITSPAGNIRISCRDFSATTGLMKASVGGLGNNASKLSVLRIN